MMRQSSLKELPGGVHVISSLLVTDTCSVFSTASTSLLSALYSILRSIVTVALLYCFCYGALKVRIYIFTVSQELHPETRKKETWFLYVSFCVSKPFCVNL